MQAVAAGAVGRRAVDFATATVTAMADSMASRTASAPSSPCTQFDLPKAGVIIIDESSTITLGQNAVYQARCAAFATMEPNSTLLVSDFGREPFLASTIPQIFVLGAMLFLAWVLVFILIITPRTYFIVGSNGGGVLGRRGILGGATGTSTVIGVGGRPWLQKAATLGVGVSLLIATVNSFNVASAQYAQGIEDAKKLTKEVVGSLELQIIRIVSFTFLWLAQVQTLIRLFPRHKEKVIIKWIGFALIFLDTLFAILNNWVQKTSFTRVQPSFDEAIPALAYLFQLALNFVYLCAVLAYSWAKRRFAYYHPKMRNVAVVAFLSICSIFVPVVFFVLDVIREVYIGWGDYCRWVGAAAASVVVWEWVERIEALEREERKDGILGREIFESDEVPYSSSAIELRWPRNRKLGRKSSSDGSSGGNSDDKPGGGSDGSGLSGKTLFNKALQPSLAFFRGTRRRKHSFDEKTPTKPTSTSQPISRPPPGVLGRSVENEPIQVPQQVASPVSRADTASAASTVYAVIHHDSNNNTPVPNSQSRHSPINNSPTNHHPTSHAHTHQSISHSNVHDFSPAAASSANNNTHPPRLITNLPNPQNVTPPPNPDAPVGISYNPFSRSSMHNPFKRQRTAPPPEVTAAMNMGGGPIAACTPRKRDRLRFAKSPQVTASELPTFTIPAREDGGAWSPQEGHAGDDRHWGAAAEDSQQQGQSRSTNAGAAAMSHMPSIDGTLNAHTASPSPPPPPGSGSESPSAGRAAAARSSQNQPLQDHTQSTPSPPPGSQNSTPSPRPPASGETGRMPVLRESGPSAEGG